jgi:hypothetical protein
MRRTTLFKRSACDEAPIMTLSEIELNAEFATYNKNDASVWYHGDTVGIIKECSGSDTVRKARRRARYSADVTKDGGHGDDRGRLRCSNRCGGRERR